MSEQFSGQVDIQQILPPKVALAAKAVPPAKAGKAAKAALAALAPPPSPGNVAIIIRLDGDTGTVSAGGNGTKGSITLLNADDAPTVLLDGQQAVNGQRTVLFMGGSNADGVIGLFDRSAALDDLPFATATIFLNGATGNISVTGDISAGGTIEGQGGDCAEYFDISGTEKIIEPGTVIVLDQEGKLRQSTDAYDKKVAGVVSGAGGCRPGIVLDKKPTENNRMPVALVGKVYCKVDAQYAPIEVGDLLTTSPTHGHGMKADDPLKAFGAVIGKSLRSLPEGKGLIPILIALQ